MIPANINQKRWTGRAGELAVTASKTLEVQMERVPALLEHSSARARGREGVSKSHGLLAT